MLGFAGLWAVPFLTTTYGLARTDAALLTSFVFVGWGVGGAIDRRGARGFIAAGAGIPYYQLDAMPDFEQWGPVEREPVRFSPEEGVGLVTASETGQPSGDGQGLTMSFEQLFRVFRQRAERAEDHGVLAPQSRTLNSREPSRLRPAPASREMSH